MGERESAPLLDEESMEIMPGLARAEIQRLDAQAVAKLYVLDERYRSFYPMAFDGKDLLFGLVVGPDGLELCYRSLSELERVNAELDLVIQRDADFEPMSLRGVIAGLHEGARARQQPRAAF